MRECACQSLLDSGLNKEIYDNRMDYAMKKIRELKYGSI